MELLLIDVIICKNCFSLVGYFWSPKDKWIFLHKELKEHNLIHCKNCESYSNKDNLGNKISLYFKSKVEIMDLVTKIKRDEKIPKNLQEKIKNRMVADSL